MMKFGMHIQSLGETSDAGRPRGRREMCQRCVDVLTHQQVDVSMGRLSCLGCLISYSQQHDNIVDHADHAV